MSSPAFTCGLSAVFTIWMSGAATQVEAVESPEPSFVVLTSPVLVTTPLPSGQVPPVAAVVCDVMCTVNVLCASVVPAGTVTGPHERTPVCVSIAQVEFQPAPWSSIDQFRPSFTGRVSVSFTPCASPAPVLNTVNVKPMSSPAFTCGLSAFFTIWMSAGWTTTGSSLQPLVNALLFESPLNEATQ